MTTTKTQSLNAPYTLSPSHLQDFNDQGFIRLPEVLDPETVSSFEPEITSKVRELNTQHLPLEERDTYNKAFLQVSNLWTHSEKVREFVFSARLAKIAADLLGVKSVRLYHDQALYKESGGGITPWHADQYYWPVSSDRTVTVWIPLQATPLEMGPLSFATGSHEFEFGRNLPISDESEQQLKKTLAEQNYPLDEEPYDIGDVSYHLGWTFHRAGANRSGQPRAVITMIYMDADIEVTEPTNAAQKKDLDQWMPGTSIGTVPAGPINPILWTP
ncbi:phytanoyl-CoA dioxygenase family protein [Pseudarthrobacter sp. SSS035]|uniref:phytanoyl-CoA dioxygenase family protein n=1 Tax=Pseudarthrobacter sp. SSS035 TaxID=2931399 RepID=UPI00200EDA42|nr:phytanoyl-CoA dioxygenase family protein [Pseudarthrobacter sp. SSS035]